VAAELVFRPEDTSLSGEYRDAGAGGSGTFSIVVGDRGWRRSKTMVKPRSAQPKTFCNKEVKKIVFIDL
jgi:hypothetical protein